MYKFQICARNEYGDVSILKTENSLLDAIDTARKHVTTVNDNSLTVDERRKNYEAFFVEIDSIPGEIGDFFYAGRDGHGKDVACDSGSEGNVKVSVSNAIVSIFIGVFEKTPNYANDIKGRPIESLSNSELNGRTAIYIRNA